MCEQATFANLMWERKLRTNNRKQLLLDLVRHVVGEARIERSVVVSYHLKTMCLKDVSEAVELLDDQNCELIPERLRAETRLARRLGGPCQWSLRGGVPGNQSRRGTNPGSQSR